MSPLNGQYLIQVVKKKSNNNCVILKTDLPSPLKMKFIQKQGVWKNYKHTSPIFAENPDLNNKTCVMQ